MEFEVENAKSYIAEFGFGNENDAKPYSHTPIQFYESSPPPTHSTLNSCYMHILVGRYRQVTSACAVRVKGLGWAQGQSKTQIDHHSTILFRVVLVVCVCLCSCEQTGSGVII